MLKSNLKAANLQKSRENRRENTRHSLVTELINRNEVIMTNKAWRHGIASTTRRSHGRDQLNVLELEAARVLLVVPVAVVDVHAEELNRRLSAVFLHLRHVHVIHKEHCLFHHGRAEHALSSLVQTRHEYLLDLVGGCLRREVYKEGHVFLFGEVVHEVVLDVGGLSCACGPAKEEWPLEFDAVVQ